ncbi:MAG: glycosyltransferase family 39 protein, partial [Candidatus Omnitrophica bacterium]|nr:glycosyltransferase family 39 protein [Candidatus Omnitrophota bacterium]
FYRVARFFFAERVSTYALMIMALSPFHIWYAQEARVYALASFLSLAMLYAFLMAVRDNRWWQWLVFSVAGALALMATYFNIFILLLLPVYLKFGPYRNRFRNWLLAMLMMGVLCAPLWPLVTAQLDFVQKDFWLPEPSPVVALFTGLIFSLGYSGSIVQYAAGLVIFGILFVWGLYRLIVTDWVKALFLGLLFLLPLVLVYVISHHLTPVYINRQLLIFSPFYYLLVAQGIDAVPSPKDRRIALICVLLLFGTCLFNYYRNYMFEHPSRAEYFTGVVPKKNYREQLDYVAQNFQEGDLVAVTDTQAHVMLFSYLLHLQREGTPLAFEQARYYLFPHLLQRFDNRFLRLQDLLAYISADEQNQLQTFIPAPNGAMIYEDKELEEQAFRRIWLVSSAWNNSGEEKRMLSINSLHVRSIFDKLFKKSEKRVKDGVYVELYEK